LAKLPGITDFPKVILETADRPNSGVYVSAPSPVNGAGMCQAVINNELLIRSGDV